MLKTGRYHCAPAKVRPATVNVHVLEGEVTSQLHTEEGLSMSSLALPLSGVVLGATGLLVAALILRIYLRRREDGGLAPGE